MKRTYKITEDYIYIQTDNNAISGTPLKNLTNEELGSIIKTLAQEGAIVEEDMKVTINYEIKGDFGH